MHAMKDWHKSHPHLFVKSPRNHTGRDTYTRALLSAVPAIEYRPYDLETYLLEGEPPDPIDIPPGCSFRTRCPFAFGRCATDDPVLRQRKPGHQAACHLVDASHEAPRPLPPVRFVAS